MSSAPHQTLRYYPKAQIRQGADRGPGGRRLRSHSKRRTTSIIVTMLAAPKRATNKKSPCAAARPQPSAASAESAASSRKRGSIRRQFHLAQSAPTRRCVATGRDLPSAPGWSAGANDPTERLSQGTTHARHGSRRRSRRTHGKRCIPPTIPIAQAAPKTTTKIRSPRSNARPKLRPASRERAISSHERGAICILFAN
jgi:hypothetical protein